MGGALRGLRARWLALRMARLCPHTHDGQEGGQHHNLQGAGQSTLSRGAAGTLLEVAPRRSGPAPASQLRPAAARIRLHPRHPPTWFTLLPMKPSARVTTIFLAGRATCNPAMARYRWDPGALNRRWLPCAAPQPHSPGSARGCEGWCPSGWPACWLLCCYERVWGRVGCTATDTGDREGPELEDERWIEAVQRDVFVPPAN